MRQPNPIFHNPQDQSFSCRGCRMRMEIPPKIYRSVEDLAIVREGLEQIHLERGCGEAMVKAQAAEYRPGQTSMAQALGMR
jgi:hypothetical protein